MPTTSSRLPLEPNVVTLLLLLPVRTHSLLARHGQPPRAPRPALPLLLAARRLRAPALRRPKLLLLRPAAPPVAPTSTPTPTPCPCPGPSVSPMPATPAALPSRRPTVGLLRCAPAHRGTLLRLPALALGLGRARRVLLVVVVAWLLLLLCAGVCVGSSAGPSAAAGLLNGKEDGQGSCISTASGHTAPVHRQRALPAGW